MTDQSKIKVLPQELINQIAAGEVVERPASVVKELVENSLDAGATNIMIEIVNGGINLIKVVDNGLGMSKDDARLSLMQHATSKISTAEDLFNINSLGFRGEALASISSVSDFTLQTKSQSALSGIELRVKDKKFSDQEIGCAPGTIMIVKDLFYNVPARQKYLKTAITEYNHIVDLFLYYVLAYATVDWALIHNNKAVYRFSAVKDLKKRLFEVLGAEITDNLIEINYNGVEMKVSGFIGKPQIARNNRKLQYLFINNRPVREYIIAKQISNAFSTLIPKNLFPVFILFIQIDTQKIDVNVHPRKTEVRFSEPQKIYQTVYRAVADALDHSVLDKEIKSYEVPVSVKYSITKPRSSSSSENYNFPGSVPRANPGLIQHQSVQAEILSPNFFPKKSSQRILGQIRNSYIIVDAPNGLKIYDQHAVSERIQYTKIRQQWLHDKIRKQKLLLPMTIELAKIEANIVRLNSRFFNRLGFELEELSNNSFMLNSVPQSLVNKDLDKIIKELVGQMTEWELLDIKAWEESITPAVDNVLKMMSCRSAIMFGDKLQPEEMQALLENLQSCKNNATCVHGRPCVIEYSFDELERLFKRK